MTATLITARDEIQSLFKVKWDTDTPAITTTVPPIQWEGVPFAAPSSAPYARVIVRNTSGGQASLSGGLGSAIGVRFTKTGTVTVSIFTPLENGLGVTLGEQLAVVAKAAFEGKATASQVWFRNVFATPVGEDGPLFMWNVTASFEYDELVA